MPEIQVYMFLKKLFLQFSNKNLRIASISVQYYQLKSMLRKILSRKPVVPIILLNGSMNQQRANKMIKKMMSFNYKNTKNIAVVVSMDQALPVQVDKILETLLQIKQNYGLKLYGFATSKCIPQSYYLLSGCDKVYASQMTLFDLYENSTKINAEQLYKKMNIKKNKYVSDQNIRGRYYDLATAPFTLNLFTEKQQKLNELVFNQSMLKRKIINPSFEIPSQHFLVKMNQIKALQAGLIDKIGHHYTQIRQLYPESQFHHIMYEEQKWRIKQFIVLLFLFKVFLKYAILTYIYIKVRHGKQKKQQQEMKPLSQYLMEEEL